MSANIFAKLRKISLNESWLNKYSWTRCGKRRNCLSWAISHSATMFTKVVCWICVKIHLQVGKGKRTEGIASLSRSARKPTLWPLCNVSTRISLSMPRRLTRIDTFRLLWIFCSRNHYYIPLSPWDGMCWSGSVCTDCEGWSWSIHYAYAIMLVFSGRLIFPDANVQTIFDNCAARIVANNQFPFNRIVYDSVLKIFYIISSFSEQTTWKVSYSATELI